MATTQIPSFIQWSLPFESAFVKQEKTCKPQTLSYFGSDCLLDEEDEAFTWLNVDHLPSLNGSSCSSDDSESDYSDHSSSVSPVPCSQNSSYTFLPIQPQSQAQGNYQGSLQSSGVYTFTGTVQQPNVQMNSSQAQTGFTAIQLPQFVTQLGAQQTYSGPITFQAVATNAQGQQVPIQNQILLQSNFGYPQQAQQQQVTLSPQFFNMIAQQPLKIVQEENTSEDRKRKASSSRKESGNDKHSGRPKRQTRPKVVEAKGAVQCKGKNRKKGTQCRNAALMEYIGPRPIYCAEHIELDPNSLYEKCKSPYQKEVGDKKGCKEVVLKEFGLCYKHFGDAVNEMVRNQDFEKARKYYERVIILLAQLEREAAAAKKKDGDLYQRKNKLIPKFQEMKKIVTRAVEELRPKDFSGEMFSSASDLSAPMLNLSSDDTLSLDEDIDASLKAQDLAGGSPFSDLEPTFDEF